MNWRGFKESGTITITDLRKAPGEYLMAVDRTGAEFVITRNGRTVAKLVPADTIIHADGSVEGALPLTLGGIK